MMSIDMTEVVESAVGLSAIQGLMMHWTIEDLKASHHHYFHNATAALAETLMAFVSKEDF
jgi:hypothetical protein